MSKIFESVHFEHRSHKLVAHRTAEERAPWVIAYAVGEQYVRAQVALSDNVSSLGLEQYITEIEVPEGEWLPALRKSSPRRLATHLKSDFIEYCLRRFNRPVWYFDVDTLLKGPPPEIPKKYWSAWHRQPGRDKAGFPVRSSMFFLRPCAYSLKFLEDWRFAHEPELEDHTPLCRVWKGWQKVSARAGMLNSDFSGWTISNGTKVDRH
jgi:hypothetical protein